MFVSRIAEPNRSFPAPTPGIEKFCLDVPIEWGNNSRRSHCRSERRRGGVKKITQFTKETQSMQQHQQQQQIIIILYSFVYLLYYIWSCVHMTFWMVVDALIIATGVRLRYVSRRSAKYIISWFFKFAHTHRRPCTMRHIHRIAPLMSCTHAIFRFNQRMHCGAKCAIITFISPVNTLNSFSFSVFFFILSIRCVLLLMQQLAGLSIDEVVKRVRKHIQNIHRMYRERTCDCMWRRRAGEFASEVSAHLPCKPQPISAQHYHCHHRWLQTKPYTYTHSFPNAVRKWAE